MKGSEKQIAWAISIRDKLMKIYNEMNSRESWDDEARKVWDEENKYYDAVISIDDARYWIHFDIRKHIGYDFYTVWMYEKAIKMGFIIDETYTHPNFRNPRG